VEGLARGFAALGVKRGDTAALMLSNRPEFHFADAAVMHLGATPFSVYNTYSPEQIEHLVSDAGSSVLVTDQAFLDTVLRVGDLSDDLEHLVLVDGEPPEGALSLAELRRRADQELDFEASSSTFPTRAASSPTSRWRTSRSAT
jgi:long-chain acyl-CoA synthetase